MKYKKFWLGMLVMMLAIGMVLIGCDLDDLENKELTVTFDLDGGNINGNTANISVKVNSVETIENLPPNPKKTDYFFVGWFTNENGSANIFTTETKVKTDKTVFAKWTSNNNGNGGNGHDPFSGSWVNIQVGMEFVAENGEWKQYLGSVSQDGKHFFVETMRGTYIVSENNITKTITSVNTRRFGGNPNIDSWVNYENLNSNVRAYLPKTSQINIIDDIAFVFEVILNGGTIVENVVFLEKNWIIDLLPDYWF